MKELILESAQRQGTSDLVATSARGYSGNATPIMVSPDIGNANCNGTSPVVSVHVSTDATDRHRQRERERERERET